MYVSASRWDPAAAIASSNRARRGRKARIRGSRNTRSIAPSPRKEWEKPRRSPRWM
ncbi:MAG: hypothetical protein A4E31_00835 [Methanomassiliicoccales archaeon PtaU1.Bin030]|nr:MAG: hypothetical protein A4E31_00835 [Methanomassiliicoccales archaeon PtaU1.Bin030]